jgi:sugar phosphate isomerase/epimerase
MRPINRITPNLPASAYRTFQIVSPISTHWRPATCEEAECSDHARGWKSVIDETTELGQKQAHYIRKMSGRKFTESHDEQPGLTVFTFEAGQRCFKSGQHKVPLGRPEHYLVKGGDWRGNPTGAPTRKHSKPEHWVEDMAENLDKLRSAQERG